VAFVVVVGGGVGVVVVGVAGVGADLDVGVVLGGAYLPGDLVVGGVGDVGAGGGVTVVVRLSGRVEGVVAGWLFVSGRDSLRVSAWRLSEWGTHLF
jgi:hypothetical protein